MDYTQEAVATLHDFDGAAPAAPIDRSAVVVPMSDRDVGSLAAERLLSSLAELDPASVVVPIRAPPDRVTDALAWVREARPSVRPIWCNGPTLSRTLADRGLAGETGKGLDVWLAIGTVEAANVAVHDADVTSHRTRDLERLLAPLAWDVSFTKGYYARVEDDRLYGRLFRLLYEPLVAALRDQREGAILAYLDAFRYGLSGEFAATTAVLRSMSLPRRWGLEVGTLGEAFRLVGAEGSAQVDLGRYEHDHRSVSGPGGLSAMASGVAESVLRVVEEAGIDPDYGTLADGFVREGEALVDRYAVDARFNGLTYDEADERDQVRTYAEAVTPPGSDDRLPPWSSAPLDREALVAAVAADLDRVE
ncbi:MAG: glycosyl transferase family 2 [Halanaeroarchaeum sp.]